jgi:hypothetical protein
MMMIQWLVLVGCGLLAACGADRSEVDVPDASLAPTVQSQRPTEKRKISRQDRVVERHDLGVRSGAP